MFISPRSPAPRGLIKILVGIKFITVTGHFIFTEMQPNPFRVLYFIYVNIYHLQMSVATPTNCKRILMIFGLPRAPRFVYKLYWILFSSFAIKIVNFSSQLFGHFIPHSLRLTQSCLYTFIPQLHYGHWTTGTRRAGSGPSSSSYMSHS